MQHGHMNVKRYWEIHCIVRRNIVFVSCVWQLCCVWLTLYLIKETASSSIRKVNTCLSQTARCHTSESSDLRTKCIRHVWLHWTISSRIKSHLVNCRRQMWPPSRVLAYSCFFMAHKLITLQEIIPVTCIMNVFCNLPPMCIMNVFCNLPPMCIMNVFCNLPVMCIMNVFCNLPVMCIMNVFCNLPLMCIMNVFCNLPAMCIMNVFCNLICCFSASACKTLQQYFPYCNLTSCVCNFSVGVLGINFLIVHRRQQDSICAFSRYRLQALPSRLELCVDPPRITRPWDEL
jgi:hypothetical protein